MSKYESNKIIADFESLKNSKERRNIWNMYFKMKKKEFNDNNKIKIQSTPFNYEFNQNQIFEPEQNMKLDSIIHSPTSSKDEYQKSVTKNRSTQRKLISSSESDTIKKGINYNAWVGALNRIQKSIIKQN